MFLFGLEQKKINPCNLYRISQGIVQGRTNIKLTYFIYIIKRRREPFRPDSRLESALQEGGPNQPGLR